jgi:DUF1707 SHOCT-like domain
MIMQPGDGTDASGCARTRVSDADRERAIDVLKAAFAEGRLTREEHAERVERSYGSRTYAGLAAGVRRSARRAAGALPSPAQRDPARSLPRPAGRTNPLAIASLACCGSTGRQPGRNLSPSSPRPPTGSAAGSPSPLSGPCSP